MFRSLFGLCFLLSSFAWSQTAALAPSPGKARWSVKTSLMPGAHATSSGAKAISYDDLSTLPVVAGVSTNDSHFQSKRIPSSMTGAQISEGTLVKTRGWLQLIALEGDGDYHIQISSSKQRADKCVIVEVPNSDPAFVSSPELQAQFAAVRTMLKTKLLKGKEPAASGSIMTHPVFVEVVGQLFYDDAHVGKNGSMEARGKKGMSATSLWEIHPVTGISFVTPAAPPATKIARADAKRPSSGE